MWTELFFSESVVLFYLNVSTHALNWFQAQTSLFVAVKNRHLRCVQLLLRHNANPNGDLSCLCTPLYVAAMDGNLEVVQVGIKLVNCDSLL